MLHELLKIVLTGQSVAGLDRKPDRARASGARGEQLGPHAGDGVVGEGDPAIDNGGAEGPSNPSAVTLAL